MINGSHTKAKCGQEQTVGLTNGSLTLQYGRTTGPVYHYLLFFRSYTTDIIFLIVSYVVSRVPQFIGQFSMLYCVSMTVGCERLYVYCSVDLKHERK